MDWNLLVRLVVSGLVVVGTFGLLVMLLFRSAATEVLGLVKGILSRGKAV